VQPCCEITLDIPFHDVDMLNVVWNGHYYKYFELARTALFRKYDFDIDRMQALGYYMVVSDSACRYARPLKYGMRVRIAAKLAEWEYRLVIEYRILSAEGRQLARGHTTHVTMEASTGSLRMATPPEIINIFSREPADGHDEEHQADVPT